jgi:penicillin-binding protein 2
VESCDVYFYDLSLALGIDRMHDFLSRFGLGQQTGIDIKGELAGILPSRDWKLRTYRTVWYPGETLITGIGQGFMLTTPLQLANITATLSTYGRRTRPNMIHAIQDDADKQPQPVSPRPLEPVSVGQINHWESIIHAMQQVVNDRHGTAHRLSYRLPYSIAGKTGTAQVFSLKQDEEYNEEEISKKLRDHALFIGFAPVEDPQIAVAVIVENGGHGSSAAAPIVRKVMDRYLIKAKTP